MAIKNNIPRKIIQPKKAGLHWIVIICIIFCQFLTYTWVRTESTQAILQIGSAQKTLTEKNRYQKALSIERNRLKSDERITRIAQTKLNLSPIAINQTIYFPPPHIKGKDN